MGEQEIQELVAATAQLRADVGGLLGDLRAAEAEVARYKEARDRAVDALCAFAEEQDGNPYDPISERLYAIAHDLEQLVTEGF